MTKPKYKTVVHSVLSSYPETLVNEGLFLKQTFIQLGLELTTEVGSFFRELDTKRLPNISTLLKYRVQFIKNMS